MSEQSTDADLQAFIVKSLAGGSAERDADAMDAEEVFRATVIGTGMYEGHYMPEALMFMPNAAHNVVRDAAEHAARVGPAWLATGLAKLRDDALVLAQRINPVSMIPEPAGELGERIAAARALHEQDKAAH